jgi:hypothetical protein
VNGPFAAKRKERERMPATNAVATPFETSVPVPTVNSDVRDFRALETRPAKK